MTRSALAWRLLAALLALPAAAHAQWDTDLALAGWPLAAGGTTANDFQAGFIALGTTSFTVDATRNNGNRFPVRITTVEVQCVAPCPFSGTTVVTGLQWRRDDQATWTALTTAYGAIEQRTLTYGGLNDPWSRSMHWRFALDWATHPPAAATQFRIRYRLVVAAP